MTYLLRRTRKSVWIGEGRSIDKALAEFIRADGDTDGLSVYEVDTDADYALVVAGIACMRRNCGRVDFIALTREEVEKYGAILDTPEHGGTPLSAANDLHRSLDWDNAKLQELATSIFEGGREPLEYSPVRVREIVRSLDPAFVDDDETRAFVRSEQGKASPRGE